MFRAHGGDVDCGAEFSGGGHVEDQVNLVWGNFSV